MREMADAGCSHAVVEATSHALSARWNRLGGCCFDIAVLTNVTHEHLDYHGSVEQYRRDKARLFEMLGEDLGPGAGPAPQRKRRKIAIVNADDGAVQHAVAALDRDATTLSFSRAELGTRLAGLDVLQDRLVAENISLKGALSQEIEVDFVAAVSELATRQASFEASLKVSAEIAKATLLNFI